MSQAHRPTWNPTQGRETKAGSQQVSKLAAAAHTKLKFRQPGQVSQGDVLRRDLKAELAAAERVAQDKKRKAAGLPPLPPVAIPGSLRIESAAESEGGNENGDGKGNGQTADGVDGGEEEERAKRRKLLQEALEADRDDDSDSDNEDGDGDGNGVKADKGKGKADSDDSDDDSSDGDSDDDDDAAALMAELAKIRQERAEEKARIEAEAASQTAASRDQEIATGNPLLNLQAALGQTPTAGGETPGASSTAGSSTAGFAVKRRWDDDLIFKNQAVKEGGQAGKGEFVNDLLRSDFHRKFMHRFIK